MPSNAMSNNDLSGAIRQRAEQLAMEDGLRLNISGEMELHQKYGAQAFSQMIQESQSFNSLQNNINATPNSVYNAGIEGVNVANHHAQSKAEVERFENQSTNSFNQKSAQEISKEWQDFFDSKNKIAPTIQKGRDTAKLVKDFFKNEDVSYINFIGIISLVYNMVGKRI